MKIYIICPVRLGVSTSATKYVETAERKGHTVFYPPRDVNQVSASVWQICEQERQAIRDCNEVHVFYDARSQGIHFDLGMAYALEKPIHIIKVLHADNPDYNTPAALLHKKKTYLSALRERYETNRY